MQNVYQDELVLQAEKGCVTYIFFYFRAGKTAAAADGSMGSAKEILELSGVHTGGRGPPFTTVCGCFGCNCSKPCLPNPVVCYKNVINISC